MDKVEVRHTINCKLKGFESLQVEYDVGATGEQVDAAFAKNTMSQFITDFPNWDDVAPTLGLVETDPETGEERPIPKPLPFPEHRGKVPMVLGVYLGAQKTFNTAVVGYVYQALDPKP